MPQEDAKPNPGKGYEERQMQTVAARWDVKAAEWDRNLADPSCHLNEDQAYQRFLDEAKKVVHNRRAFCSQQGLIDCGCATGLVLQELVPAFAWGIGVDISPEMIRVAQAKEIPNSVFVVGDCFHLSACSPPAGAIVSRGILLSHYGHAHALALLRSARAALVPQGFLFCDFLNLASRGAYRHVADDKTHFNARELCALARTAGFAGAHILGKTERRIRILMAER